MDCSMCDFLLLENEMLLRFAASLDVETLSEATKYIGTDDTRFIRTITTRSKRFLGRISYLYREDNDKTLISLVDENCSDYYAYLARFLVLQPSQSDALLLDLALEGPMEENDTNALIEFLCARHPRRVRSTKKAWEKRNDASLVDRLSDELHGDLRKIALTMLKGKRMDPEAVEEEDADMELAKTQAATLKDEMEDRAIDILCSNSPAQNAAIARQFEEAYDMSLQRAIGQVFDGNVKSALTSLTLEPSQWYAARLKAAFKGIGSKERTVCRIVGAHDKDEIKAIALAYDDKYGTRLKTDIDAHTSGNFKRLAVAWIDLPDQLEQPAEQIVLPVLEEDARAAALAKEEADREKEEEEEDFEEVEDPPPPSSSLYKAKVIMWQAKLAKAKEAGRPRKIAYFERLLCMYPPVPSGHQLLADYAAALTSEYKNGEEGMVGVWIQATDASTFEEAGTTKELFDEWQNTSEACVRDKNITIGELKHAWGLSKKEKSTKHLEIPPAEYETTYEPPPTPPPQPPQPVAPPMPPFQPMTNAFGQAGGRQMMMQSMQTTTHTVQHTIVHQPQQAGVQRMAATVPFGVYGGMQMTVNTTYGPMRVTVPPGYGPGSSFTFNVPVRGPMVGMAPQYFA
uniref:Annexin n=1 Tax=Haptolina brevifila TaxID=156173 RepID=A0A7S2GKX4_9EUKA|mmetsp:Transcript_41641/g.83514  ORF Transcript_41641/g.83514 Transcript_41641/m.83514 type:complete len:627 (+) Transcript_41641:52-1932(+)